jgi:hypothetical protein
MIQLGLPSTALAAFVGPLNLVARGQITEMDKLVRKYLPHILQQAHSATFFMNIYFEHHFTTDIVRSLNYHRVGRTSFLVGYQAVVMS